MCSVRSTKRVPTRQIMETTDHGKPELTDPTSSGKITLPTFPGENPSELELKSWLDASRARLRVARLLAYATSAVPTAPPDLTERAVIPPPAADAAEGIKTAVATRNLHITADNIDRKRLWRSKVKERSDLIAGALEISMRPIAPGRLDSLVNRHKLTTAGDEHLIDGGGMFREIQALTGQMDEEQEAALALKQVQFFQSPQGRLPDNVAPNQFDARIVEFDKHVNPALEMNTLNLAPP